MGAKRKILSTPDKKNDLKLSPLKVRRNNGGKRVSSIEPNSPEPITPVSDNDSSDIMDKSLRAFISPPSAQKMIRANVTPEASAVKVKTTLTGLEVILFNSVRHKTNTKNQGDHATAYRTFFEILASCIDEEDPLHSIGSLYNTASYYLPVEAQSKLNELKKVAEEDIKKETISRTQRQMYTASLRKISYESPTIYKMIDSPEKEKESNLINGYFKSVNHVANEQAITQYKNMVILANGVVIARNLEKLLEETLKQTNMMPKLCFPRIRTKGIDKSREGTEVREAIKALKALDRFIAIAFEKNEELKANKYQDFIENNRLKKGLEKFNINWHGIDSINRDYIDKLFSKKNYIEKVGEFMEDLYDYRKTAQSKTEDYSILCETAARHIVMILHAFRNFRLLSKKVITKVIDEYLKKVLHIQEWENFGLVGDNGNPMMLNLATLRRDVNLHLHVDLSENIFKVSPAVMRDLLTERENEFKENESRVLDLDDDDFCSNNKRPAPR